MRETTFDTLTRRVSVQALADTGVLAAVFPMTAAAGKAGKKARKRCQKQDGACQHTLDVFLSASPLPAI
jgi:hypothetical protein